MAHIEDLPEEKISPLDYERALPVSAKPLISITDGDKHYTFLVDKITLIECNNSMCRIYLQDYAKVDLYDAEAIKEFKRKLASCTVQV